MPETSDTVPSMPSISAEIQLRPTRIGFLVRPTDLASVREIMRCCACLWGGSYNPIIPVFKRPPKEWKPEIYERTTGEAVVKGYVRFFEPDVYVEAETGLLELAGLGALREQHLPNPQVIKLDEFFAATGGQSWAEPKFGLNVHDVLAHIYKTERQFVLREKQKSFFVKPERQNALVESIFGVYPTNSNVAYIKKAYTDVYEPEAVNASPEIWRQVFLEGAKTPLYVTKYALETQRHWYSDTVLFVFDPAQATDLIDLWNMRLEQNPVLPIPIGWFNALSNDIHKLLKATHRPVVGNPNGVLHSATIEFGRSISKDKAESLVHGMAHDLPEGAYSIKSWRNRIWIDHRDDPVHRPGRLKVLAKEQRIELPLKENGDLETTFKTLEPEFSSQFGGIGCRWTNVLHLSNFRDQSIATVLPFNTFDRKWPRLNLIPEPVLIGSEGWVYPQKSRDHEQYISLLSADDAIIGSLEQIGVKGKLSEPGHIAKQMLEHVGGLWGMHLFTNLDTLKLLNDMAGGVRRKDNKKSNVEENFALRTADLKKWTDHISTLKEKQSPLNKSLEEFTKRNVIRLGLETKCPNCNVENWTSLTAVDYRVNCERCLKTYEFPQASLGRDNKIWTFRVVGPFAVPDFGRGSYSALLALRFLDRFRSSTDRMTTYATAMNLEFDDVKQEVDFIAWLGEDHVNKVNRPPQLIIGEAKSLAQGEMIKSNELEKLKRVATKLTGTIIVIAVLRDHFTEAETIALRKFVNWSRRVNVYGEPTNPVILLTSHELTMDFLLKSTWEKLGGKHAKFADYRHHADLFSLADATQNIYLDMPSFEHVRRENLERRRARHSPSK